MAQDYDITEAFRKIENELIASMIRNMDRHRAEEDELGINWTQWQAEQLKALESYKVRNQKKYQKQFQSINNQVESLIEIAHDTGNMEQEIEILEAIRNGFKGYRQMPQGLQASFFRLNEKKLEALIQATVEDMQKAETAILRMANDKYRKAIFNAQVYANTGAGTYEKAVDMATKDMLAAGLNCVEYANGARHTLADYADMAIRTASKRAYLQGEGQKRQEWGISTVIMNKRGNPCPKCLPFCGKVLIDDVWSGGSKKDGPYPLMSHAIEKGLYHPRCKDSHTTYFPGISTADDTWTQEELKAIGLNSKKEAKQQYARRQSERFGRLAKYSLDSENRRNYGAKEVQWNEKVVDNIAESDKIKNIEVPSEINCIGGMSDDTAQAIQSALDRLFEEYDIMLDELMVRSLGRGNEKVPFQYIPQNVGGFLKSTVVINKDYYFNDSLETYTARIMRNHNSGVLAAKSVEDLIAHELAHVLTFQDCETYAVFERVESEVRAAYTKGISGYADASFDGAETIAEAFIRKRHGEVLPENVSKLLEKYIERWRK